MQITINYSVYEPYSLKVVDPLDMAELHELLCDNAVQIDSKDSQALLVPVSEWIHYYRGKHCIRRMSPIFMCDLDRLSASDLLDVAGRLDGISSIWYPTHSHLSSKKDGLECYRVILELDREYDPWDLPLVWRAINELIGGRLDPATERRPDLGYYLPSAPPDRDLTNPELWAGDTLSVDELLEIGRELRAVPELESAYRSGTPKRIAEYHTGTPPSKLAVTQQLKLWHKQGDADAGVLLSVLDSKVVEKVEPGDRNAMLFRLATRMAYVWRSADPEKIAKTFDGSGWAMLDHDGDIPIEIFADMIHRQQVYIEDRVSEERASIIEHATAGQRDGEITLEEKQHLTEVYGLGWQRHAVAILDKSLYLLRPDGTYDPCPVSKDNLFVAARDRMAVFGDSIEYTYETARGPRKKPIQMFLEDHATVIDKAIFDLTKPSGGWDPANRTIMLQVGKRRVDPKENKEIQAWLNACDPILVDMISQIPHHSKMLPALLLTGTASTGKTMLAKGISRIYADGPADADAAFDSYNASTLCNCPIVFMDERVASQYKKEGTTFVRRFLTQDVRRLDEKYRSRVELHGYVRLIIAGNSIDIMATEEDMTVVDRDAFAERIVHVDMDQGAKELAKHSPAKIQTQWLNDRRLAAHVLWLADNWQVRSPGKRFVVQQPKGAFQTAITSHTGITQDVLYMILQVLASPGQAIQSRADIHVTGRELFVTSSSIFRMWDPYMPGYRKPSPASLSKAVKALAAGHASSRPDAMLEMQIDKEQIAAANAAHGVLRDLNKALAQMERRCIEQKRGQGA